MIAPFIAPPAGYLPIRHIHRVVSAPSLRGRPPEWTHTVRLCDGHPTAWATAALLAQPLNIAREVTDDRICPRCAAIWRASTAPSPSNDQPTLLDLLETTPCNE